MSGQKRAAIYYLMNWNYLTRSKYVFQFQIFVLGVALSSTSINPFYEFIILCVHTSLNNVHLSVSLFSPSISAQSPM